MSLNRISILKNPIQEYAWGSKTDIQTLIGDRGAIGKPMAELWMGAHPKAPSQVLINGEWQSIDQIIQKEPETILGKNVAEKFSNQLPFLFKNSLMISSTSLAPRE
jgi:mannose-6-phosphate isomerase